MISQPPPGPDAPPSPPPAADIRQPGARPLLHRLLGDSLLRAEHWESLPAEGRAAILECSSDDDALALLVGHGLLTGYQAARVSHGRLFGLVLGNYRVLDRIGSGGTGVVYRAEHLFLQRLAAIKVVQVEDAEDARPLERFFTEMQLVARLQHPNIVAALDAGKVVGPDRNTPILYYLVMEYVEGKDLEAFVQAQGPLPPALACHLAYQIAQALAEAHKHHLVHRDVKPSNVLVTPQGQAKLLDFGLAREFCDLRMTPGKRLLGTLDFLSPEQASDASTVDIRTDLYGLGGTLYWCLAGRTPFDPRASRAEELAERRSQPPPRLRTRRPDLPAGLDAVVARLLAVNPDDRYPTPQAVLQALVPYLRLGMSGPGGPEPVLAGPAGIEASHSCRVLLVHRDGAWRERCSQVLEWEGHRCDEAAGLEHALLAVATRHYDAVLFARDLAGSDLPDTLTRLRQASLEPHLRLLLLCQDPSGEEAADLVGAGADDYLSPPWAEPQLLARLRVAFQGGEALRRADDLSRQLLALLTERAQGGGDAGNWRRALVLALADLVEYRNPEKGAHLLRMQRYARRLAEEAAQIPALAGQIDGAFLELLECCVPLHDIGQVALPDYILLKSDRLEANERVLMEGHTVIGSDLLRRVASRHGSAAGFLNFAADIARHHHERYDGLGYPDRLAGPAIPLAARLTAFGDVYDALRSRRAFRRAHGHAEALDLMGLERAGQFDPLLCQAFRRCSGEFERIYRETPDGKEG